MRNNEAFARWFQQATGYVPYPYQTQFACEPALPRLVQVPTGLGKTAMAVLGWLWREEGRRLAHGGETTMLEHDAPSLEFDRHLIVFDAACCE
ncbi:MAG: hypothetical protein NZM29_05700 [Nitrospira sp.]|nr:hypothetical protein [Nitrospira sp.]